MQDVNRLKLVLVEQKKTSKWLSEKLGVSPSTVSKWCTNSDQLEKAGIVGEAQGSKPRDVLIMDDTSLEKLLSQWE